MILKKEELEFNTAINKEWIITNGLGGYSSSTILGINTRKYHGLLVAPLDPPAQRHLILSKVDESVSIEGKNYNLYSNISNGYVSEGYLYQTEFEKEYFPIFTYNVEDIIIKKIICLEHRKNTVCILYSIYNNGPKAKLTLSPIINFRDFHTVMTDHKFNLSQEKHDNKIKIQIDNYINHPIYFSISEGEYFPEYNNQFNNMKYIEEEARGFAYQENHAIPRKI